MKLKPVSAFQWKKNGPNHVSGPGGFVICNYDPREEHRFGLPEIGPLRWVLYGGNLVQICADYPRAQEWVVATMRAIAEEYRKAGGAK